jgi:hypothetical protein
MNASHCFLKNLIAAKWEDYGLWSSANTADLVSEGTIRSRVASAQSIHSNNPGTPSPLSNVEELIVQIAIQMGKIRQPLSVCETIDLANSIIDNSEHQRSLDKFKAKRYANIPLENLGKVGTGWWNGFIRRHGHRLVTKTRRAFCN